ncbi:hypothetical protein MMC17_006381 [Xylographa soralifera]|nr:hypothetical protein [Xylographa soralifera]
MSSQRLQAQRGARPVALGESLGRGVATREIQGLNSNMTPKPDQKDHELLPPSRGTDITENDLRDRASVNASPTGNGTTRSVGESTRPLHNASSNNRLPYHNFAAYSRQTHGVTLSNPKSNGSFRSSFLLPSRRVSQNPARTNLHNTTQEYCDIISPPSIEHGNIVQQRKESGRNHQYFSGNTAFLWGGRIQNTKEKPINIATGTLVVLPSILFFVFSAMYLWQNVSPAVPIFFAYNFFICISSFIHASITDPGILPRNLHPIPTLETADNPLTLGPSLTDWTMIKSSGSAITAMDVPTKYCKTNTDAASVSSSNILEPGDVVLDLRRVRRVRTSVHSYNENVLSGSARQAPTRESTDEKLGSLSIQTFVSAEEASRTQLICNSIQVLNPDWKVDSMPGNEAKQVLSTRIESKRQVSGRLNILERDSSVVKSAPRKRSRGVREHGMEKFEGLTWRSKLRPRMQTVPGLESPTDNNVRMTADTLVKKGPPQIDAKRKAVTRPKIKRWLSQGLYVGQERDFNPRLTGAKNKLKRASAGIRLDRPASILPLPMFGGQRILETGRDFRLPFDIFSPLSPGQPKPEEWRKTQKNVFVRDAAECWKKSKRLEHSTCICDISSGCDENCLNRFMFYECDDTNCIIGTDYCTNRSFEDLRKRCKAGGKYNIGVEVIKTTDRGHGVRSNRTFNPNQIIVEYTGEIITQDECDSRMRKMYKDNECFYLMVFDQNMIIDATRGSIARFVNHSCEPNCKMIKWTVAGKPRMALFAGERGVMTGEELTYDYNFDPFSSKNIQECRCGAPTCRGVLGPKPKDQILNKVKYMKEALQPLINNGTKRKLQQVAEQSLDLIVSKKRKTSLPTTIKAALTDIKRQVSAHIGQAKVLATPNVQKEGMMTEVSERSLRGSRRESFSQRSGSKTWRRSTITYTKGKLLKASLSEQQPSQCSSVRPTTSSVRPNVLRNIRDSTRAGAGKKIRSNGYEET